MQLLIFKGNTHFYAGFTESTPSTTTKTIYTVEEETKGDLATTGVSVVIMKYGLFTVIVLLCMCVCVYHNKQIVQNIVLILPRMFNNFQALA